MMEKKKFPERLMINAVLLPMDLLDGNEGQIPDVPTNPRFIRPEKYEALKKSLTDSPEMLGFREIVAYPYNGRYVVVDGNMRTRALREIGYEEVPVKVLPVDTPASKLREYVHKDNYEYGENDQSILHDDWAEFEDEFNDWGMDDIFMDDIRDEEVEEDVDTQPIPAGGEVDIDSFDEKVTMKLQFSVDENRFVRSILSKVDANLEIALLKTLGYDEQES